MRVVIALGGNALLRRGEPLTANNMRENVRIACQQIAPAVAGNEIVIVHGNGPQIGLLALQNAAYPEVPPYPLDVLGAQTEGMIGYMLEQELGNQLANKTPVVSVVTQTEVDANDPAFKNPTKPVGPVYSREEADLCAKDNGWTMAEDGDYFRRVVASPKPKRLADIRPIQWLLDKQAVVICAGGGGIPTVVSENGTRKGVEAVIDKDLVSSLLSCELMADYFIIATDVDAVYVNWGKPDQKAIRRAHPDALAEMGFAAGSMGPKVEACIEYAVKTGKRAVIGALENIVDILEGKSGTTVTTEVQGIEWAAPKKVAEPA